MNLLFLLVIQLILFFFEDAVNVTIGVNFRILYLDFYTTNQKIIFIFNAEIYIKCFEKKIFR